MQYRLYHVLYRTPTASYTERVPHTYYIIRCTVLCCALPDFRDILEDLEHSFQLRQHSPRMAVKPHRLPRDDDIKPMNGPKRTQEGLSAKRATRAQTDWSPAKTSERQSEHTNEATADRQGHFSSTGCDDRDKQQQKTLWMRKKKIPPGVPLVSYIQRALHAMAWSISMNASSLGLSTTIVPCATTTGQRPYVR